MRPVSDPQTTQHTNQLLRNGLLMLLSGAAGILTVLISVPVVIHYLGAEGYGVWESLLAIAAFGMVIQSAVSGTILWRISACFGVRDHQQTRHLVRLGFTLVCVLLATALPLVWSCRDELIVGLRISPEWQQDAARILPLLVAIMVLGGVNQVLVAVLNGYERSGLAALIQSLGTVLTNFSSIAGLMLGGGLSSLLLGYLVSCTIMFAILLPVACHLCGPIRPWPAIPSYADLCALGPFAGLLLLSNATLLFRDQTDKLVLASLNSPMETGYFVVGQRMAGVIMQLCMVWYTPLTATVGALHAVGNQDAIRQIYVRSGTSMIAFTGLFGFLLVTLRTPLLVVWLGHDQPQSHGYLALAVFGVVSAILFSGPGVALVKGIGRPGFETIYTVATLGLIMVSKPLLVSRYGATGSVISSSVAWAMGAAFFLWLLHRSIELPQIMLSRTLKVFLLTLGLSGGGWWLSDRLNPIWTSRGAAFILIAAATPILTAIYLAVMAFFGVFDFRSLWETISRTLRYRHPLRNGHETGITCIPS